MPSSHSKHERTMHPSPPPLLLPAISRLLNALHHRIHDPKITTFITTNTLQKPINLDIQTHSIHRTLVAVHKIISPRIGYSSERMRRSRHIHIPTQRRSRTPSLNRTLLISSITPHTPSPSTPRSPSLNPPNASRGQDRPGSGKKLR